MDFSNYFKLIEPWAYRWVPDLATSRLAIAGSISVGLLLLYLFYCIFFAPLSKIPGSLLSKITPARSYLHILQGISAQSAREDYFAYGDIYTIGPNTVSISNPSDCRRVLGSPEFSKHPIYRGLSVIEDVMISTLSEGDARARHKRLGHMFTHSNLSKLDDVINRGIDALFKKWDGALDQACDKQAVEINYLWHFMMTGFDIVSVHVVGQSFAMLEKDQFRVMDWASGYLSFVTVKFVLGHAAKPFLKLFRPSMVRHKDDLYAFTNQQIQERRMHLQSEKLAEMPRDALQSLLQAENDGTKFSMTPTKVSAEVAALLLAGTVSTSQTMCYALHYMLLNPTTYRKAVAEVRSAFPHSHTITYLECKEHLPYVEACIYESMRVHAIAGAALPRVAPTGGVFIQGRFIPQGTVIAVNIAGAHHHKGTWETPRAFVPERFIADPEAKKNVFAFSFGARSCPGRNLAIRELLVLLSNMLKSYDFEIPKDSLFRPDVLDEHGHVQSMPSVQAVMIGPKYPARDCRVIIRKAVQI
ncbi:hypothetical protein LPJ57_003467 [Coemansia sp. RSA 486]|nr:hypothetical protein LPJ57_003467 [Coemansia sp. RSA 486]KAJ2236630.1 hypothetical protein IWW45_001638 [Coemansia sp. RSA 485]